MAVIADVFDVVLIDDDGGVIGTTTLQDSNIEVQVKEQEVRGGKGNKLLGILHSDRDINISMNDINFRLDWVAKQLGQDIVTGAGKAYATPKWFTTESDAGTPAKPIITLDNTPATPNELAIYNQDGVKITGFTVSGTKVTFGSTTPTVAIGDKVEVRTYAYNTDPKTETVKIDNSVFAEGVKAILTTVEVDESKEKVTHIVQYQFYKTIPTGNFTINTSAERQAQAHATNLRVITSPDTSEVGIIQRIPVS
ncbi:hypothetical protein [Bacillus smithii]|uniref:hypothetical protein n=1 Tax=Bacillus smithii TaxID=1479 RepID=UPI003D1B54C3